jgi:hypothetical protein
MTYLSPWRGYWIKALQPCQLIIPPVEQAGGSISGDITRSRSVDPKTAAAAKSDGWQLKLVARRAVQSIRAVFLE